MSGWLAIAEESLDAAKRLTGASLHRSAVSRAYYATYQAATGALEASGATVGTGGRSNPGHDQLWRLVKNNLLPSKLTSERRSRLAGTIRRLQRFRVAADYVPESHVSRDQALMCVHDAASFIHSVRESTT